MKELIVAGQLSSLAAIAQYIQALAIQANLSTSQHYQLRLAVDEISTNIILHGYQAVGLQGMLRLQAVMTAMVLTITIEDTGTAYDPHAMYQLSTTAVETPLTERPLGGLGIYLAFQGVDELNYERRCDRNYTRLVINRETFPESPHPAL